MAQSPVQLDPILEEAAAITPTPRVASPSIEESTSKAVDDAEPVTDLNAQKAALESEILGLKSALEGYQKTVAGAQEEADGLAEELDQYNGTLNYLQGQHANLISEIHRGEEQLGLIGRTITERSAYLAEAHAVTQALPELKSELTALLAEKDALVKTLTDHSDALADLVSKQTEVKAESTAAEQYVKSLGNRVADLLRREKEALETASEKSGKDADVAAALETAETKVAPAPAPAPEATTTESPKDDDVAAAANDEEKKEEEKKTYTQRMHRFMIDFFAHPATKAALVIVFTAGLLALGVAMTSIFNLAAICVVATVGLFSAGYVYHRAQLARKVDTAKAAEAAEATMPEDDEAEVAESEEVAKVAAFGM